MSSSWCLHGFSFYPLVGSITYSGSDCSLTITGVVFSISRSRYTLPVQFIFLMLNGLGIVFGTIYNVSTPDLYENNAHHTLGWVATWVVTAQVVMSLFFLYSGRSKQPESQPNEHTTFLPMSSANMVRHNMAHYHDYRWSGDSGQGTERSSRDVSPNDLQRFSKPEAEDDEEDEEGISASLPPPLKPSRFRIRIVDRLWSTRVPSLFSAKLLRTTEIAYEVVDRTILILGFAALLSGGAVYAGIFVSAQSLRRLARTGTFEADRYVAWQKHFQWNGALRQRRNILRVWTTDVGKMDGLLCRSGLGMEHSTEPYRSGPMESLLSISRIRRVVGHLHIRLYRCLHGAYGCLG